MLPRTRRWRVLRSTSGTAMRRGGTRSTRRARRTRTTCAEYRRPMPTARSPSPRSSRRRTPGGGRTSTSRCTPRCRRRRPQGRSVRPRSWLSRPQPCKAVYATSGYDGSSQNMSRTSLEDDNVFGEDDGVQQLATRDRQRAAGVRGSADRGRVARCYHSTSSVTPMSEPRDPQSPAQPAGTPPGTWVLGRVKGIRLTMRVTWLPVAVLLAFGFSAIIGQQFPYLGSWRYVASFAFVVAFTVSILIHELAHALVALRFKIPVTEINLGFFAAGTHIEGERKTPFEEFAISVVGPLASLLVGGAGVLRRPCDGRGRRRGRTVRAGRRQPHRRRHQPAARSAAGRRLGTARIRLEADGQHAHRHHRGRLGRPADRDRRTGGAGASWRRSSTASRH